MDLTPPTQTSAAQPLKASWFLPVAMIVLGVLLCATFIARQVKPASARLPAIASAPPFKLTDQNAAPFGLADLLKTAEKPGHVWIADFVFTHCAGPCPIMTLQMAQVQKELAQTPAVRFVSFSVDPERDTPPVLAEYARQFNAQPGWSFLTGEKRDIHALAERGFLLPVVERRIAASQPLDASIPDEAASEGASDPEHSIGHSVRFVLVDHVGKIRGYYDGTSPDECSALVRAARVLARDMVVPPAAAPLPAINATLNAACTLLLVAGFAAIRLRMIELHRIIMLSAFAVSTLFLVGYLTYHLGFGAGATRFAGPDMVRRFYVALLLTHTVLAVVIVPLVLISLYRGLRGQFPKHRRIARITLPLWLYVSFTGVVIYAMLYHLYPPPGLLL